MKRVVVGLIVGVVVIGGGAAVASTPPHGSRATGTVAGGDNSHVFTVGEVTVPDGDPGTISVVLTGPDNGSTVPMIVRNNTADTLYNLVVNGVARDEDGTVAASGSSQGFEPPLVEPGQWAMGYVHFGDDALTGTETFEWQTPFDADPGFIGRLQLTISEAALTYGEVGLRVVGFATNENADPVGASTVSVACFDGPNLLGVDIGYTDSDETAAGGFSPFAVVLFDVATCPGMAVAASGYTQR